MQTFKMSNKTEANNLMNKNKKQTIPKGMNTQKVVTH